MPGARIAQIPVRVAAEAARLRADADTTGDALPEGVEVPLTGRRLVASLALDEVVLGLASGPSRLPDEEQMQRVATELRAAEQLYDERGWLSDPASYHRSPGPIDPLIQHRSLPGGVRFEHLRWRSGFQPREDEPGAQRWSSYVNNRTAHAYVLRHHDPTLPWVVCLHGLGTGVPAADFFAFRVTELFRSGVNVVLPALPRHGPRKQTRRVDEFLTHDLMEAVHGLTQAVWDLRALLGWVREHGGRSIAAHGISLGGYVAALLATLETDLGMVIAGVPLTDVPGLFAQHSPTTLRTDASDLGLLGSTTDRVFRVVSPLQAPPLVPRDRLAVYGGQADRMSTLAQARRLWEHWDRPAARWYAGNHVGVAFNREAREFVDEQLQGWLSLTPATTLADSS